MRARWRARGAVGNMLHMSATAPEHSPLELYRLLANMIRTGRVVSVRTQSPARCRVQTGDLLTDWVPWVSLAAGGEAQTRHWRAPALDEPCLLLSPGGDLCQAVAVLGLVSSDMPQNGQSEQVQRTTYGDGTCVEYDSELSVLRVHGPKLIKLQSSSQIVLDSDVFVTGKLFVKSSIRADGAVVGAQGVWPPVPRQVPAMTLDRSDQGIAP